MPPLAHIDTPADWLVIVSSALTGAGILIALSRSVRAALRDELRRAARTYADRPAHREPDHAGA
jgi:hypothetical protein